MRVKTADDCDGIRTVSESSTQRHAGMQGVTAAARPTELAFAACTAWDAAAAGGARAREPARWDGPYQLPTDHWCRYPIRPALLQQTHHQH